MFSRSRGTSAVFLLLYVFVVLSTVLFAAVSCALLLSQAVRTSHKHTLDKNFDAVVIGAAYVIVVRVRVLLLRIAKRRADVSIGCSVRCILPEAEASCSQATTAHFEDLPDPWPC